MTNRDPRRDAMTRFYAWHDNHKRRPYADMTRDLENAAGVVQNGFAIDSTEYWEAALSSAYQSERDYFFRGS